MKWYEWVLVLSLMVFSNVLTFFLTKEFLLRIKTVDLMSLGLYSTADMYERLQRGEDPQKVQQDILQRTKRLEEYLSKQRGLVLIKQCVLHGDVEDITNEVANYLRSN